MEAAIIEDVEVLGGGDGEAGLVEFHLAKGQKNSFPPGLVTILNPHHTLILNTNKWLGLSTMHRVINGA